MKCPKCLRDNAQERKQIVTYIKCPDCGEIVEIYKTITEPTTAEMLLWLVENNYVITRSLPSYEMSGSICKAFDSYPSFRFGYIGMDRPLITLAEAIKQAYEWAKKEELNVKN